MMMFVLLLVGTFRHTRRCFTARGRAVSADVAAVATLERVGAETSIELIVAVVALEKIARSTATEGIVICLTLDKVGICSSREEVVADTSIEEITTGLAKDG